MRIPPGPLDLGECAIFYRSVGSVDAAARVALQSSFEGLLRLIEHGWECPQDLVDLDQLRIIMEQIEP